MSTRVAAKKSSQSSSKQVKYNQIFSPAGCKCIYGGFYGEIYDLTYDLKAIIANLIVVSGESFSVTV